MKIYFSGRERSPCALPRTSPLVRGDSPCNILAIVATSSSYRQTRHQTWSLTAQRSVNFVAEWLKAAITCACIFCLDNEKALTDGKKAVVDQQFMLCLIENRVKSIFKRQNCW